MVFFNKLNRTKSEVLTNSFLIAPKFLPQASRAWANNSASDGDQSLVTILEVDSPEEDGCGTLHPSS